MAKGTQESPAVVALHAHTEFHASPTDQPISQIEQLAMSASLAAVTLCNVIVPLLPSFCTEDVCTVKVEHAWTSGMAQTLSRTVTRHASQCVMTHQTRNFSSTSLISFSMPRTMIDFICPQVLCITPSFGTFSLVTHGLFGRKSVTPKLLKPSTCSWMMLTLSLVVALLPHCAQTNLSAFARALSPFR